LNGEASTARTKQISAIIAPAYPILSFNKLGYGFRYTQGTHNFPSRVAIPLKLKIKMKKDTKAS
jgi:hypothetical protein